MNSTQVLSNHIKDYYIVCSFSGLFAFTAVAISIMILILVWRTKPGLHTVRHLLICNTCIGSILYCIIQIINYIILIFFPWITSDVVCRWRGYFGYVSISVVMYSYLAQAVSRLFISVFATKYPYMTTFKGHYVLILMQWILTLTTPLPSVITHDIYFRPGELCWVPAKDTLHMIYSLFACYIAPVIAIVIIYIYIYNRIRKVEKQAKFTMHTAKNKRDLEVLRNISILMGIYVVGGFPTLIFIISSLEVFYLISVVTITLAVMIEKMCTILLDRDLRQVIRKLVQKSARITPFTNIYSTPRNQRNLPHTQRIIVQPSLDKKQTSSQLV